jgi:hypothetical protein
MPFGTGFEMRLVCTRLTDLIGFGSWFDSFTAQNTMCLSLVKEILAAINSVRKKCGVYGLYPSHVAGILKHVVEIMFYVSCNDELTYSEYTEKAFSSEMCINCVSCGKE